MDINALLQNRPSARFQTDISPLALERWNPGLQAASKENNTIDIFDVIGDYWGEGVTVKRISAALRSIGEDKDVIVNINSPGGDLFEGLAIHSLFREHEGKVTMRVLSLAASSASVIAMSGDEIQIAKAGFFMIHNSWVLAMGNRHDLLGVAEYLEPFDRAMGTLYSDKTGIDESEIESMMDKETWISGADSINQGFADDYLSSDQVTEAKAKSERIAAHKLDVALAKAGMSRTERKKLLSEFKSSMQDAAGGGMPGAAMTGTRNAVDLKEAVAITRQINPF